MTFKNAYFKSALISFKSFKKKNQRTLLERLLWKPSYRFKKFKKIKKKIKGPNVALIM